MRILLKVADERGGMYLVSRLEPGSVAGVLKSVGAGKYAAAIVTALSAGGLIEEIPPEGRHSVRADLVITRESAHWDLCAGRRRR